MHIQPRFATVIGLLLLTSSVIASTVTSTTTISTCPSACASDNCFRQLAGRTASASTFCHTFTTSTVASPTAFPTYLSISCGVSRASSVCSCLFPTPPTSSPPSTTTSAGGDVTVTSTTTVVACPSSLNILSHGNNPCLSPWTSQHEIIENNVGNYTLKTVLPAGAPSSDGVCELIFNNTALQESFAEYELTHTLTFPIVPHAYTLSFWVAAIDAVSAAECYVIASFATQSNEESFYPLSTAWQQFVLRYEVEAGDNSGYVAIVVTCEGRGANGRYDWGVRVDEVVLFLSRP